MRWWVRSIEAYIWSIWSFKIESNILRERTLRILFVFEVTVSLTESRFDIPFICHRERGPPGREPLFELLKRKENSSPLLDSSVQTLVQNVAILVKTRVASDPLSIGSGILTTFPFILTWTKAKLGFIHFINFHSIDLGSTHSFPIAVQKKPFHLFSQKSSLFLTRYYSQDQH